MPNHLRGEVAIWHPLTALRSSTWMGIALQVRTCPADPPSSQAHLLTRALWFSADLFLVCTTPSSSQLTYQIWTNSKSSPSGFVLSRTGLLPEGAGALSFADMDRDGTIDVVFPSCDGAYGECYINIAFNRQAPLCAEKSSGPFGTGPSAPPGKDKGTLQCRDPEDLCHADPKFLFNFTPSENNDVSFYTLSLTLVVSLRLVLMVRAILHLGSAGIYPHSCVFDSTRAANSALRHVDDARYTASAASGRPQ